MPDQIGHNLFSFHYYFIILYVFLNTVQIHATKMQATVEYCALQEHHGDQICGIY